MAGMTTALTEHIDNGNSITYFYTGHTAVEPRLVIQRRKLAPIAGQVLEDSIQVLSSTEDGNGDLLSSKVLFEAKVRRPNDGISADVDAALVVFRDIVASDEFTAMVSNQARVA